MTLILCIFQLGLVLFECLSLSLRLLVSLVVSLQTLKHLLVLGLQIERQLLLSFSLILEFADQGVPLLKLLFDDLELLWIRKRIF